MFLSTPTVRIRGERKERIPIYCYKRGEIQNVLHRLRQVVVFSRHYNIISKGDSLR